MRPAPKSKIRKAKRPFVFSNFAMTADGKTAFPDHHFVPFGSKRDQEHLLEMRATADAIISGARTIDLSGATLRTGGEKYRKLRLKRGLREANLRVIVSGSGSIDPEAEIFKCGSSPVIILTTRRAGERLKKLRELAEVKICGETEVNFAMAFRWLRKKWNIQRLLCEGGGELHGSLVCAGLVDELHLTICPTIFGGRTSPTIADGDGFAHLSDAARFQLKSFQRIGDEVFLVLARSSQ